MKYGRFQKVSEDLPASQQSRGSLYTLKIATASIAGGGLKNGYRSKTLLIGKRF